MISIVIQFAITETPINMKLYISQFLVPVNSIIFNGPLWFLVALFFADIFFYFIVKLFKKPILIIIITIIVGRIGYHFFNVPLYFELNQALYFITFISIGFFFKQYNLINRSYKFKFAVLLCMLINILSLINQKTFYDILGHFNYIESYAFIFKIFIALAGIITYTSIAKLMENSKMLNYLGKNSLIIFGLHMSIGAVLVMNLFNIFSIPVKVTNASGLFMTVMILVILYPICKAINNYFPFMLGKFNLSLSFKRQSQSLKE